MKTVLSLLSAMMLAGCVVAPARPVYRPYATPYVAPYYADPVVVPYRSYDYGYRGHGWHRGWR